MPRSSETSACPVLYFYSGLVGFTLVYWLY